MEKAENDSAFSVACIYFVFSSEYNNIAVFYELIAGQNHTLLANKGHLVKGETVNDSRCCFKK